MATNAPLPDSTDQQKTATELSRARVCHLLEKDGSRWEVVDLDLSGRRVWVTARAESTDLPLRTFDTILTPGTRLVWTFPDGGHLEARQAELDGELHWERSPPFFEDEFLTGGPEPRD